MENNNRSSSSCCCSNLNKYEIFINKEYKDIRLKELRDYAINIGVDSTGNKQVLYERVKKQLKEREQLEKEKDERDSINSFNKGRIELVVKDISRLEQFFWSAFRNKSIYKQIVSNFKLKTSYSYERLFNVDYILSSYTNGKDILLDKIKNDEYLDFNGSESHNSGFKSFCLIFKKDTIENRSFIQRLLSSYRYSKSLNKLVLVNEAINNSNIMILKLLNTTKEDIEMILKNQGIQLVVSNYSCIKMVQYLIGSLGYQMEKVVYNNNNSSSSGINKITVSIYPNFNIFDESLKLKHLIKIIESFPTIYHLSQQQTDIIESLKSASTTTLFTSQQLKSSVNQILGQYSSILVNKNNSNNNNNNSSSGNGSSGSSGSDSYSNSNNNQIKSTILKYIDLFYSVICDNKDNIPINYYILFKDIESIKNKIKTIIPSSCSGIKYLDQTFNYIFEFAKKYKNQLNYDIFKYYIQLIRDNTQKEWLKFNFRIPLKLILESGDIGLIQLLFEELSLEEINSTIRMITSYKESNPVIPIIESIQVLDYLYQHYPSLSIFNGRHSYCFYVKDITILKHFEELMAKSYKSFSINRFYEHLKEEVVPPVAVLSRAINNENPYSFKGPLEHNYFKFLISDQGSTYNNQLAIKLFKSKLFNTNYGGDIKCKIPYRLNFEFIYWLNDNIVQVSSDVDSIKLTIRINNNNNNNSRSSSSSSNNYNGSSNNEDVGGVINYQQQNQLKEESISTEFIDICFSESDFSTLFYILGRYNQLLQFWSNGLKLFIPQFNFISSIEFIDQYIEFTRSTSPSSDLKEVIESLLSSGNLTALNFIKLKYNQLLTKKSKSNPDGVLDSRDLKRHLINSIIYNNYHMILFLLNYINISKIEYNKSSRISVLDDSIINKFK